MEARVWLYSEKEEAGMAVETQDLDALLCEVREEPHGWEVVAVNLLTEGDPGPEYSRLMEKGD